MVDNESLIATVVFPFNEARESNAPSEMTLQYPISGSESFHAGVLITFDTKQKGLSTVYFPTEQIIAL